MRHPATEQLATILDTPDHQLDSELMEHLKECKQCNKTIEQLQALQLALSTSAEITSSSINESDALNIAQLIDDNRAEELQELIDNKPDFLKQALYYQLSKQQENNNPAEQPITPPPSSAFQWLQSLFNLPQLAIMATVALMTTGVILTTGIVNQPTIQVASYQDDATIHFKPAGFAMPGMGFFNQSISDDKAYTGITVTFDNDDLILSWPAIENATQYQVDIYQLQSGNRQKIYSNTTKQNSTYIHGQQWTEHLRYQWDLSGTTSKNMEFQASGGFIFNRAK